MESSSKTYVQKLQKKGDKLQGFKFTNLFHCLSGFLQQVKFKFEGQTTQAVTPEQAWQVEATWRCSSLGSSLVIRVP